MSSSVFTTNSAWSQNSETQRFAMMALKERLRYVSRKSPWTMSPLFLFSSCSFSCFLPSSGRPRKNASLVTTPGISGFPQELLNILYPYQERIKAVFLMLDYQSQVYFSFTYLIIERDSWLSTAECTIVTRATRRILQMSLLMTNLKLVILISVRLRS